MADSLQESRCSLQEAGKWQVQGVGDWWWPGVAKRWGVGIAQAVAACAEDCNCTREQMDAGSCMCVGWRYVGYAPAGMGMREGASVLATPDY
jgi:hypothetical protein